MNMLNFLLIQEATKIAKNIYNTSTSTFHQNYLSLLLLIKKFNVILPPEK
jgi:hypothetical protein